MPFFLTGSPATLPLESPYTGAEVTVLTDVPLSVSLGIGRWMAEFGQAVEKAEPLKQAAALRTAWAIFGMDVGISWNVHDRRGPVPLDEAFGRAPDALLVHVLTLWAVAMTPSEEPDGEPG